LLCPQTIQTGYAYNEAGNLNYRTNNVLAESFGVNSLNQLSNPGASGTLTVAGTTTSPATNVTVWRARRWTSGTHLLARQFDTGGRSHRVPFHRVREI
jgi:hypothetical protein